jgi:hypothetical protein
MLVDFDGDFRSFEYEFQDRQYKAVLDGSQAITYSSGVRQVELRSPDDQNDLKLFDPRCLGLSTYYNWGDTVEIVLGYKRHKAELIGKENISGHELWHVKTMNGQWPVDYWIDADTFRVYKRKWLEAETMSYYEMPELPVLPSRVECRQHRNGKLSGYSRVDVLESTVNVRFPSNRWSLAAMNVPTNTTVIDIRRSEAIGRWDGKKLVSEDRPTKDTARMSVLGYVILGVFLLCPVVLLIRLKVKQT